MVNDLKWLLLPGLRVAERAYEDHANRSLDLIEKDGKLWFAGQRKIDGWKSKIIGDEEGYPIEAKRDSFSSESRRAAALFFGRQPTRACRGL